MERLEAGHDQICIAQKSLSLPSGGGLKGEMRVQRPGSRPGQNKMGEDRVGPRQSCEGEKGASGRHPGVLVDKLWGLMGQAGEEGIKDEAQGSLWELRVWRGHS